MNDSRTSSVAGHFPTFRRLFGWLFSWRTIRRCLFALACLLTLIALFYAEENWRGRRAWNKYRHELEARGAQFDYRAFIPKPVPDEQNFAATPLVKSWFLKENSNTVKFDSDDYGQSASRVSDSKDRDKGRRQFLDLVAWKSAFIAFRSGETNRHQMFFTTNQLDSETRAKAAPDVLEGLKTSDAILEELRASSKRPHSRYPVNYDLNNPWGIMIPHLAKIKGVAQRLHLKACAELAAAHDENALSDVKLALYLADSLKEEPFLISYLVRIACVQIAIQTVWEGLAEHRWSDAQLQELQSLFQRYNFFADMKLPLEAERATGVLTADLLDQKKYRLSELGDVGDQPDPTGGDLENLIARFAPRGWYHLEQLNYCRLYENQLKGTFDPAKKTVSPREIESRAHELEREVAGGRLGKGFNAFIHHQVLAAMLLPALGKLPFKAAAAQTAADQAALACALERYRLANGQFPEKLDALAPRFMDKAPNDVISGGAMKYRRTEDGWFILYSVGWNVKDDGGMSGKTFFDEKEGDWVWSYPPATGK
jgi:hypothetical protein